MLFNACNKVNEKLSAFMDGELAPEERAAIKEHLSSCAACAEELRLFSAVDAGMKNLPATEPTPFFAAKVSAAARALGRYHGSFRRFLRLPVPAMALLVSFLLINIFTFAFNINAMENGQRRELARKVVSQLAKPASLINPVAVARLCGECSKYMCLCMHEAGKQSLCPCKDCEMGKAGKQADPGELVNMEDTEKKHVH